MSALVTAGLACCLMLAGVAAGVWLRQRLQDEELNEQAERVVRLGIGLITTLAALVLGLLISSASNAYEGLRGEIREMGADVILLDDVLRMYGDEALPARGMLRDATRLMIQHVWQSRDPSNGPRAGLPANPAAEQTTRLIFSLPATSESQALLKTQALQTIVSLQKARDRLFERAMSRVPPLLIGILVFWLVIIFTSFSLFSPLTRASLGALVIIAVCAAAALFLILEMGEPFSGFMQISDEPLVRALRPLP